MDAKMDSAAQFNTDKVNNANVENAKAIQKVPFDLKKFFQTILTFFTVEPYLLCYIIPSVICSLTLSKLNMEKACRADLNYTETVCLKVVSGDIDDNITGKALKEASVLVAQMTSWKDPLQTGIPAIFILFIGAWSDRTGNRKTLLLIPLVGEFFSLIGLIIGTYYFLEWPLWVMGLIEAMSSIFTGGLPVALMASYSYIADVTTPESRTFRIGVVAVIVTLGIPMGTSISGVLTEGIGYYGVFGVSLLFFTVGFIHTLFKIHDVRRTEIEGTFWYKLREFFHPRNIWETVSIIFTSRGVQLANILLVIWAHIVIMGPVAGEGSVLYLYTLNKYNMDLVDFSLFNTYSLLMGLAGTSIAITIFSKWLKFHDTILGLIATCSKVASSTLYGLAPTRNWFFVGPVLDIFGNSGITAIRSLGTKVVDQENVEAIPRTLGAVSTPSYFLTFELMRCFWSKIQEQNSFDTALIVCGSPPGKMCSVIGFIDSVVPAIYTPIYNNVLTATLESFPGAVYILGAVMTAPDFIIFVVLYIFQKRLQKDVVQNPAMKEMHVYDNDVTSL